MNPLHSNDIEMSSDPPRQTTIEPTQSQDFQVEFIAKKKAVDETEAIVEKLYEQAKQIHAKDLEELEAKENTWIGNLRRWIINLKHAFFNNIPAPSIILLKDVQPALFMILAILAYGVILGLFIYFFYSGIVTGQNNKFISLTPTSGNCDNVDTTLNLQQYISQNGAWQGFKRFSFHKAKYLVNFQSFNAADFSSYMTTIFGTVLKDLGEQAKSLPLYWNLITWATYTHYTFKQQGKEESVTTFGFVGDTSTIFNRQNRINAISNNESNCRGQSNSYDYYHGIASQGWVMDCEPQNTAVSETCDENSNVSDYKFPYDQDSCNSVLTPDILDSFGWNPKYTGKNLELHLDLVSMMTAVSLNLGITNSTNLENANIEIDGIDGLQSFFDARFPNSDPIFCTYDAVAEGENHYDGSYGGGFSYYGGGFSYYYGGGFSYYYDGGGSNDGGGSFPNPMPAPTFPPFGGSRKLQESIGRGQAPKTTKEKMLWRSLMKQGVRRLDELSMNEEPRRPRRKLQQSDDDLAPYCYARIGEEFCLPVIVPYNEACMNCTQYDACKEDDSCDPTQSECYYIDMIAACIYDPSREIIFELPVKYNQSTLFELARNASVDGLYGPARSLDEWCPGCLIYVFNADDDEFNINEYRYQLSPKNKSIITGNLNSNFGHCEDSFTIPQKEWSKLVRSPPAPLTELYYQCTKKLDDVVFDSFGIASSNAFTIGLPVLSVIIVTLFTIIASTKIVSLPKDVEDKLAGKRELKRSHIEKKLFEVDPEYHSAREAHKKALEELNALEIQYKELRKKS